MQIALTKKLADALKIKPPSAQEDHDPMFAWVANWVKVWDNRRTEDMLVLVNLATRFTVAIYQVKRKDLKNITDIINTAIQNALLDLNINPEVVAEYMRLSGEITYAQNRSRHSAAWVTKAGQESSDYVGRQYNGVEKIYDDTVGAFTNNLFASMPNHADEKYHPYQAMISALSELTGKEVFQYQAYELMVTLDLEHYKAVRKLIVPANMTFTNFHKVLQAVFGWKNSHLHDFTFFNDHDKLPVVTLVPYEETLEYFEDAILIDNQTLAEFLPNYKHALYTYDLGDNWQHEIKLVRVIGHYNQESPYLLEAVGQTPPEDVGGVHGFIDFLEIMKDPSHPEYAETKLWAGFWAKDLHDWEKRPRIIHSVQYRYY